MTGLFARVTLLKPAAFGLILCCSLAVVFGCERKGEESAVVAADSWPSDIKVSVIEAHHVFDENWEIRLQLKNESEDPFVISELTEKQAKVVLSDGSTRPIHAKSVGNRKKVTVPSKGTKATSLLFAASTLRPVAIVLKGKRFEIGKP